MSTIKRATLLLLAVFTVAAISSLGSAQGEIRHIDRPGISIPECTDQGIKMFWHTKDRGNASAPAGWRLERRRLEDDGWRTQVWQFLRDRVNSLQTFSDKFWDFVDSTAMDGVAYTYRVIATDAQGNFATDRLWSRRAPVTCG